jgi:hypothetical protein
MRAILISLIVLLLPSLAKIKLGRKQVDEWGSQPSIPRLGLGVPKRSSLQASIAVFLTIQGDVFCLTGPDHLFPSPSSPHRPIRHAHTRPTALLNHTDRIIHDE